MENINIIYKRRIEKVVEYINTHLDQALSLNELADVACFSPYHFHRIFVALIGETVNNFTTRLRLEKSARLLKFSKNTILKIALESGFSSAATFSRSFKQYYGITPMDFRKNGSFKNSKISKELHPISQYLAPMKPLESESGFSIQLKTLPRRKVAFIEVVNSFQEGVVLQAYEDMIHWAKEHGIYESESIFGMSLDDINVTPKEKYRYEVCLTVPEGLEVDHERISTMYLPQCKYVTTLVSGDINLVTNAYTYLYNHWLIKSSYEPEHQHAIEIFKDKENVCNWNHFDLELCIPIKSI